MGNIGPSFLRGLVLTLFLAGVIVEDLPRGKIIIERASVLLSTYGNNYS
jgi:hypothetical protein